MEKQTPVIFWNLVETVPGGDGLESFEWLSTSERSRLAGLRFPKRRREWLNGRLAAKSLLLGSLNGLNGALPADISIENEPYGAPFVLYGEHQQDISLSISHRDELAFCAFTRGNGCTIGVDVEKIELRSAVFAEDYFTEKEQRLVGETAGSQRDQTVTLIWSAKEAALKALKKGLRLDTRSVEIQDIRPAQSEWGTFCVRAVFGTAGILRGWWQARGDYVLTLAILGNGSSLDGVVLQQKS